MDTPILICVGETWDAFGAGPVKVPGPKLQDVPLKTGVPGSSRHTRPMPGVVFAFAFCVGTTPRTKSTEKRMICRAALVVGKTSIRAATQFTPRYLFGFIEYGGTIEAKCLFDADKLDCIGAIGIIRNAFISFDHGQDFYREEKDIDSCK